MIRPRRILGASFSLVRLVLAAALVWILVADTPARLERLRLSALPGFDYSGEVEFLRSEGRYGEALVVADDGLEALTGHERESLVTLRQRVEQERTSWVRRLKDAGMGAVSGRGDSLESLLGAITADLFVVGDIRDIVVQGGRLVVDGETDEVILVLSGVGLATTVAPQVDWVPSVLKAARKAGSLSRRMGEAVVGAVRRGDRAAMNDILDSVRRLSAKASPGGAARMLKHADDPADLRGLVTFVERNPRGAFVLHATGADGAALALAPVRTGATLTDDAVRALDGVPLSAARRGEAGRAWLRTGGYKTLLKPHPLVGIAKALYKGNAERLVSRVVQWVDPRGWWLLPLASAWLLVEAGLFLRRFAAPAR